MNKFIFISFLAFIILSNTSHSKDKNSLSLENLGFKKEDMNADLKLSSLLKERRHDLDLHEKWAISTTVLMTGALLTGKENDVSNTHKYLGIASGLSYYITSYYALKAPIPPDFKSSGASLWHKRLAWIHFPAMVLAPALGLLAERQLDKGEEIHGIAKLHKPLVAAAFWSFAASLAILKFDF
jgi:hypothetical protein